LEKSELAHIITLCIRDNRQAQNALYKEFYSYGMSIVCRYITDKQEAVQILNESYFKVFTNLHSFTPELDFKPWFKTIVINSALNHIKKMKKFTNEVNIEDHSQLSFSDTILSKLHFEDIIKMVQSLSSSYRTVFNLYVLDGYKHEDIAQQLGITVSTSKSNLARAKEKLRDMILNQQLV
jgi:RNA polymerase sigma factor (sigma-70 family)